MKTLIVISGVTGAIGTACLAQFSRTSDTVVYGLSRKGRPVVDFTTESLLPSRTLICGMDDITSQNQCDAFAKAIDSHLFSRIIYVHAVGVYPFEVDSAGTLSVRYDHDGDGIDDRVMKLSHNAFFGMSDALAKTGLPTTALIFGGVADRYTPQVHVSWWSVMNRIKASMAQRAVRNVVYHLLNISSVICPNEILTRPFVFLDTDADPRYWLTPYEVAEKVMELVLGESRGFTETTLYHPSSYYYPGYFEDENFTTRKLAELGYSR